SAGERPDPPRARALLEKYCAKNAAEACYNLGVLLRMGDRGVEQDPDAATAALEKACNLESAIACGYLKQHGSAPAPAAAEEPAAEP
ncbi:MAG TPA: hypothetical protein PLU22_28170, partial [Polyangiaceae bacterium]|nr:hypothetical protein [Polyangiaceae bacterium]